MSNKKRSSKRKLKLPNRFNDHVMSNLSQKHQYSGGDVESKEIRVDNDDRVKEIRENSKEMEKSEIEGDGMENHESNDGIDTGKQNGLEEVGDDGEGMNKEVFGSGLNVQNADDQANKTSDASKENVGMNNNGINGTDFDMNNSAFGTKNNVGEGSGIKVSYASRLSDGLNANDNELFYVPTVLNENGEKMVVFEEEMVREGSEKWRFTICGYFVGCKMGINELRYNIRRMWGRFGLKDIVVHADGLCYFKFKTEEGMNQIIDQSPWFVNGKPLIVQKWDPDTIITKESPGKIPIWIRLLNIPLEA
ncbi:RNA-directed DNA polymerase, eukaryota, reverse transcriptase zinc-binding domain protein [Tanacetum coccineum]